MGEKGGPGPESGGDPRARLGWRAPTLSSKGRRPGALGWGAWEDETNSLADGPESRAGRGGPSNGGAEACSRWAPGGLAVGWVRLVAAWPLVSKTRVGILRTDSGNAGEESEGLWRVGRPHRGPGRPGA